MAHRYKLPLQASAVAFGVDIHSDRHSAAFRRVLCYGNRAHRATGTAGRHSPFPAPLLP